MTMTTLRLRHEFLLRRVCTNSMFIKEQLCTMLGACPQPTIRAKVLAIRADDATYNSFFNVLQDHCPDLNNLLSMHTDCTIELLRLRNVATVTVPDHFIHSLFIYLLQDIYTKPYMVCQADITAPEDRFKASLSSFLTNVIQMRPAPAPAPVCALTLTAIKLRQDFFLKRIVHSGMLMRDTLIRIIGPGEGASDRARQAKDSQWPTFYKEVSTVFPCLELMMISYLTTTASILKLVELGEVRIMDNPVQYIFNHLLMVVFSQPVLLESDTETGQYVATIRDAIEDGLTTAIKIGSTQSTFRPPDSEQIS